MGRRPDQELDLTHRRGCLGRDHPGGAVVQQTLIGGTGRLEISGVERITRCGERRICTFFGVFGLPDILPVRRGGVGQLAGDRVEDGVKPPPQLIGGLRSREAGDRPPGGHRHHGRHRLHTENLCDLRTGVDVDPRQGPLAAVLRDQVTQGGGQCRRGLAARRSQQHDDRDTIRLRQYFGFEIRLGHLDGPCISGRGLARSRGLLRALLESREVDSSGHGRSHRGTWSGHAVQSVTAHGLRTTVQRRPQPQTPRRAIYPSYQPI
ncbi:Uncharacterised protein [Mycobacteroides abscessus subsp. massiliense]|nr:Uncharacterised protein [Mycobacteroides abscessus subsp. massiliense]